MFYLLQATIETIAQKFYFLKFFFYLLQAIKISHIIATFFNPGRKSPYNQPLNLQKHEIDKYTRSSFLRKLNLK